MEKSVESDLGKNFTCNASALCSVIKIVRPKFLLFQLIMKTEIKKVEILIFFKGSQIINLQDNETRKEGTIKALNAFLRNLLMYSLITK